MSVAIVDSGGANIASVRYALGRLGCESALTTDAGAIERASHVILPGVGAARDAMARLRELGLDALIPGLRQPVLGICLGLQLLSEGSEEGTTSCLRVFSGAAHRLPGDSRHPVPHMGWNQLRRIAQEALLAGVPADGWFYFVHSYAVPAGVGTVAVTDYGGAFASVVRRGNFCATQFHPERSGPCGARVLQNFLRMQ